MASLKTMVKEVENAIDMFAAALVDEEVSFDGQDTGDRYKNSSYERRCNYLVAIGEKITEVAENGFDNLTSHDIQLWIANIRQTVHDMSGSMFMGEIEHSEAAENAFKELEVKVEALTDKLNDCKKDIPSFAEKEPEEEAKDIVEAHIECHIIDKAMPGDLAAAKKDFVKMTEKASLKFIFDMLVDEIYNSKLNLECVKILEEDSNVINKAWEKKGTISVAALKGILDHVNDIKDTFFDELNDSAKQLFIIAEKALGKFVRKDFVQGKTSAEYVNIKENADKQKVVERTITEGLYITSGKAYMADLNKKQDEEITKAMLAKAEAKAKAAEKAKCKAKRDEYFKKLAESEKKAGTKEQGSLKKLNSDMDSLDVIAKDLRNTNASLFTKQSKQFKAFTDSLGMLDLAFEPFDKVKFAKALCRIQDCREAYAAHCEKHKNPHSTAVRNKRVELANKAMRKVMEIIKNPEISEAYKNAVNEIYKDNDFMRAKRTAMISDNVQEKAKAFISAVVC